jgi:hypothetical protein
MMREGERLEALSKRLSWELGIPCMGEATNLRHDEFLATEMYDCGRKIGIGIYNKGKGRATWFYADESDDNIVRLVADAFSGRRHD